MADAAYLQEKVGPALSAGLASVAAAQPDDPVDFLAHWLLKYLAVEEKKLKVAEAGETIKAEREALEAAETAKASAKEERFFSVKRAMTEVQESTSTQQMFSLMVKAAREMGRASNVYLMLLEQRPPPEGQEESPEPEAPPPPEPVEGEELPPPPEKLDPWMPKYSALKCIAANPENSWLVGKEIYSPAFGKHTVSYKAVDGKAIVYLWNVMESDPPVIFHDMPMPGSLAVQPIFKAEDEKYKAGGVLGVLCADTVGEGGGILTEEDKEMLVEMGRVAGATYEKLQAEGRKRKEEEDAIMLKLIEEELIIPEEGQVTDEDDVETLEGKLDGYDKQLVGKAKAAIKANLPVVKASEHGRSLAEFKEFDPESDSGRVGAALCALVEGSLENIEELDRKIAAFNIKTISEDALSACTNALTKEGAEALTPMTPTVEFPGQLVLALIQLLTKLSTTSLKIQNIRADEEEARLAEIEKERVAVEEAAAAEAPPAEG